MKHEGSTHPSVCYGVGADEREGFVSWYLLALPIVESVMVMKPVRLLCYMFLLAFLGRTVHSVQYHSYQFELTDQ